MKKRIIVGAAACSALFASAFGIAFAQAPAPSVHTIQRIQVTGNGSVSIEVSPPYQGVDGCANVTQFSLLGDSLDWMTKILLAAHLANRQIEIVDVNVTANFCQLRTAAIL